MHSQQPPSDAQDSQINPTQPPSGRPQGDPAGARPMIEEADIGSGEKTPAEHDTEELIRQVPPLPGNAAPPVEPPSPTRDR